MSINSSFSKKYKVLTVLLIAGILISSTGRNMSGVQAQGAATVTIGDPGLSFRYLKTFGKTEVAYLADKTHLNYPYGLGADGANIWVAELWGNRSLKYNNTGGFKQQIGVAGVTDVYDLQTSLSEIADSAVDGTGNIWVVDDGAAHIAKFDSSGNFLGELGTQWERGTDNSHFDTPMSITFDTGGNMYVSDGAPWWNWDVGNHRIQVFDSSGDYLATIGETGIIDSDNSHFHGPRHIVTYGNQLFVADAGNQRVQIFDITNPATPAYEATIGISGEEGSDNAHFSNPSGVALDADYIYVVDTWNNRVQVFNRITRAYIATIGTGWGTGNYQFRNPTDVAIDSSGRLYVADFVNTRVQQFTHSGFVWTFARKYGATNVPYLTDGYHYNRPSGVAVAGDGSIYITEENGHRLVKLSSAGVPLWTKGVAGVKGDWNDSSTHLDNPADVALDAAGHVYVADRWYGRVKIFNPNGTAYKEINGLGCPGGVSIAPDGLLYVADSCDHTIKIYNNSLSQIAILGISGESGSDNAHFNWPEDVVVNGDGEIFVADQGNQRIQVFNPNGVYLHSMGVTGECGASFDHFCNPNGLFVDNANRLYVADQDNNRVQVFDESGAYLTTIGGGWGTKIGDFRAAMGVAVDKAGNVYVADNAENHRIQKFAPGVPGWAQININGFGDRFNRSVTALEVFGDALYAGAPNWEDGGSIWRSSDAHTWEQVTEPGFGDPYNNTNPAIIDMVVFDGQLYASVGWDDSTGQLWRSADGTTWEQVVGDAFGDSDNFAVTTMAVYGNMLYVGTGNSNTGAQIWRSSSGDISTWENVVMGGLGCGDCNGIVGLIVFNDSLYATVGAHTDPPAGAQVWRTTNGNDWNQVGAAGFGSDENWGISGLASFNGSLYVGTRNDITGGQVWKSSDGTICTQVVSDGFGDLNNHAIETLKTFGTTLYAGTVNNVTGFELWASANGSTWSQINLDGFGDSNNDASLWSNAVTGFNNNLYIGTWNWNGNGGEVWQLLRPVVMNINSMTDTGDGSLGEGEQVIVPVTKLTVTFNEDIKKPTVSQFTLKKGTTLITINSVGYDSLTKTVTLNINGGKKLPYGAYSLTIKKTITDPEKNAMGVNIIRRFTLVKPPSVPSLLAPANKAVVNTLQPKLDWSNSIFPAGTAFDHYQLQLATDAAFTSPVEQNTGISEFTLLAPLASGTKYYWRVRAYNTLGQASAWSTVFSFTTP
jgi:hypothetical protein